jgi:glycosyltransferase involved in cell wall biosynthesis
MAIHQFVHTLNYGDAISGEAVTIQRELRKKGINSNIYSVHAHEKVQHLVRRYQLFEQDLAEAIDRKEPVSVILHYSIASPLNTLYLNLSGVKRALIYHNLTPVEWFSSYNARVADDLIVGREELPTLLQCSDINLADSSFNQAELEQLGCDGSKVLPLLIDDEKWKVPSNPGITSVLKATSGVNFLHVGRLAPNKCITDIIKVFYFYHHKINSKSKLWLIGSDIDSEIYSFELRRLVSELRLKEVVTFVGSVADSELRSFYESSDLYLCMSEHEGFCVPLLEAMNFGVPVIAFDSCAVADTLGDGGILVKTKLHAEIAELANIILTDSQLRASLKEKGKSRANAFALPAFLEALNKVLIAPLENISGVVTSAHSSAAADKDTDKAFNA